MSYEPLKRNVGPIERDRARRFRKVMSLAETKLWNAIRGRRLNDWKFRRQFPIDNYVADFVCLEAALVVELDGESHDRTIEGDKKRTRSIEERGFEVIRFLNEAVLFHFDGVLRDLIDACERRAKNRPSP